MNMKNLAIKTAYETIKTALSDWALDDDNDSSDFANYVLGVTEVIDALIEKLNESLSLQDENDND